MESEKVVEALTRRLEENTALLRKSREEREGLQRELAIKKRTIEIMDGAFKTLQDNHRKELARAARLQRELDELRKKRARRASVTATKQKRKAIAAPESMPTYLL